MFNVSDLTYQVPTTGLQRMKAKLLQRRLQMPFKPNEAYKTILNGVSLTTKPGEFVAIIGASGCGKTTLLNMMGNRIYTKTYSGVVELNGVKVGPWAKRIVGYVQQEDILYPLDTPTEAVRFQAEMKLKKVTPAIVDRVIDGVGLQLVRNNPIGQQAGTGFDGSVAKSGLSGGEKKRVAIAREIATGAQVLLCDEPTSGLDLYTANQVVQLLSDVSKKPHDYYINPESTGQLTTVIATLHQPSSQMWDLFDRIVVMRKGEIVYQARPSSFEADMAALGYSVPHNCNPADFLIGLVTGPGQEESAARLRELEQEPELLDSTLMTKASPKGCLSAIYQNQRRSGQRLGFLFRSVHEIFHPYDKYATNYLYQFWKIHSRNLRFLFRSPGIPIRMGLQYLIASLFAGSLYWQQGTDLISTQNEISAIFFLELCVCFGPAGDFSIRMFQNRLGYLREHASGLYATQAYFISHILIDLPINVLFVLGFCAIAWFMIGFNGSVERFFLFYALTIFTLYSVIALSMFVMHLFKAYVIAAVAFALVLAILIIFAGPFINGSTIPAGWAWMNWFSVFAYASRGFAYTILWKREVTCTTPPFCFVNDYKQALQYLGFGEMSFAGVMWSSFGYMLGWAIGFFHLSYLALRYRRFY